MKLHSTGIKPQLILLTIILIGLGLRFFNLGHIPVSLYWDEAAHLLELKLLTITGIDQFSRPWLQTSFIGWGDFKLPAYTWFSLPLAWLSLPGQLWVRALSAVSGVATIIGLYILAKLLGFSSRRSLLTAFAVAISPWLIQFSRAGFEANLALSWLVFSAVFLLLFIKSNTFIQQLINLILFTFASLFGLYSYFSFRWAIVGVIIFLVYLRFEQLFTRRKMTMIALALTVIFIVGIFPQYRGVNSINANRFRLSAKNVFTNSDLVSASSRYIEADNKSPLSRKLHHRFWYYGHDLAANILSYFDGNYLLTTGDSNLRHGTGRVGILYWWQALGLLVGVIAVFSKNKKLGIGLSLLWLWLLVPGAITYESPHAMRTLGAAIPIMLLIGYGWGHILRLNKSWFVIAILSLIFITAIELNYYLHDYYIHYPVRSAHAWQDGYRQVFEKLNQLTDVNSDSIVISDKYFLPHLYFLLYTDYSLPRFQAERTAKFAQTGSSPFSGQLGGNITFVGQNEINLKRSDTTYISADKLTAQPCRFTQTPVSDSTGQVIFYLYTPR